MVQSEVIVTEFVTSNYGPYRSALWWSAVFRIFLLYGIWLWVGGKVGYNIVPASLSVALFFYTALETFLAEHRSRQALRVLSEMESLRAIEELDVLPGEAREYGAQSSDDPTILGVVK